MGRSPVAPLAGGAGIGLSAWEGTLRQSDAASHWSVAVLLALTIAAAFVGGRGRQRRRSGGWARGALGATGSLVGQGGYTRVGVLGATVWSLLIAATVGWDLNSFAHQQHDLPTLSRLLGDVTGHDWGRAVVFAGWLFLGAYLAMGWRRPAEGAEEREAA